MKVRLPKAGGVADLASYRERKLREFEKQSWGSAIPIPVPARSISAGNWRETRPVRSLRAIYARGSEKATKYYA